MGFLVGVLVGTCWRLSVAIPLTIYRAPQARIPRNCCGDCGNSGCWPEVLGELLRRLPGGLPFLLRETAVPPAVSAAVLPALPPAPRISPAVSAAVSAAVSGNPDGRGNGNLSGILVVILVGLLWNRGRAVLRKVKIPLIPADIVSQIANQDSQESALAIIALVHKNYTNMYQRFGGSGLATNIRQEKGAQTQTFWSGYSLVGWGSST